MRRTTTAGRRAGRVLVRAMMTTAVLAGLLAVAMPAAVADPCPDAEVIFARGTEEPPGPGAVGQAFYNAVLARAAGRSIDLYSVNYPATTDFPTASQGIVDADRRVRDMAVRCPDTRLILGGFSQGAAVIGYLTVDQIPEGTVLPPGITGPLPPEIAEHVAAVALFGTPSAGLLSTIGAPPLTIGPGYTAKTIELCAAGDFVCGGNGNGPGHLLYAFNGMPEQAADFAITRL